MGLQVLIIHDRIGQKGFGCTASDNHPEGDAMEGNSISRERLIHAGIQELEENGLSSFSLRRVAQRCGVSCAAPYKHFKDKGALIQAIAEQYNAQWTRRQARVLESSGDDISLCLREICKEYLRFLLDNPNFCTLATQMDAATSKWHLSHLLNQSSPSKKLIEEYCRVHHMAPETAQVKINLLRGLLFGVAMMVGTGELCLDESTLEALYREINNAFLC